MKERLLKLDKISNIIEDLAKSIYETRMQNTKHEYWELFFKKEEENSINNNDCNTYDTGAIALAISALCCSKDKKKYNSIIVRAANFLKSMRNENGSWPAIWREGDFVNEGIVYNTVTALQALIDAGELDHESLAEYKVNLHDNVSYVIQSVQWLYSQKILKITSNIEDNAQECYGWGYTGDAKKKNIYIMPTINALVLLKRIYCKIAKNQPDCLGVNADQFKIADKTLLNIINEIQNTVYSFRNTINFGWGKDADESEERIAYTMYSLYGLSYGVDEFETILQYNSQIEKPNFILTQEDIKIYLKKIVGWYKNKCFELRTLDNLDAEDIFDTYLAISKDSNGKQVIETIDHESFFESIAIKSIVQFLKICEKSLKNIHKSVYYRIICKLSNSLLVRMNNQDAQKHTVVKSRRGLLSQIYPIYAVTQTMECMKIIETNHTFLKKLKNYSDMLVDIGALIAQTAIICLSNIVLMDGVALYKIIIGTSLVPISDIAKKFLIDRRND